MSARRGLSTDMRTCLLRLGSTSNKCLPKECRKHQEPSISIRELRRRDREGQIVTKREIQAEHQRKMSTSRYDLEDGTTAELAGLNTKLFDEHNKNGACRCAAVCLPHAEAVLRSLLLSDEDFHALYENERQSDG